jgi:membrane fusion protein, heavy metal efflux system
MSNPDRTRSLLPRPYLSGAILSLLLLTVPATVRAHGGHGNEFQSGNATRETATSIQVDPEIAKQLGIIVEPVANQRVDVGLKTTGQIETLPNQRVEVTTPTPGKVVELLVEPGASVRSGQPVAVLAAPELVDLRVSSQEKRAEAEAEIQRALADLRLAEQNLERQRQIAAADLEQATIQVNVARERYDRDRELEGAGALPRRQMLESQALLAQAQAELARATSQREVLEAENQLQHARSGLQVAQSRLQLSNAAYQTRLQQLGTLAHEKGLVVVTAAIAGRVAEREVTLGQAFEEAGGKLMTIVNDRKVFVTANIYEKDLAKVKAGQRIRAKVPALPDRAFNGRITILGSVVDGEARVVPVKAELDNPKGALKPGMFAELEVLTAQTATPILAIPTSAVVDANGKHLVYLQNGNAFQAVEVVLGQTVGDLVEVKSGLFEGDAIVTQRAPQLYAQSLRGSGKSTADEPPEAQATEPQILSWPVTGWMGATGGIALVGAAFMAGAFWSQRRNREIAPSVSHEFAARLEDNLDNHKRPTLSGAIASAKELEDHRD